MFLRTSPKSPLSFDLIQASQWLNSLAGGKFYKCTGLIFSHLILFGCALGAKGPLLLLLRVMDELAEILGHRMFCVSVVLDRVLEKTRTNPGSRVVRY